jgi:putative tryptophan/tyrosine transport system substrate-binding protein
MDRRSFLLTSLAGALAAPRAARAQPGKIPRVGVLTFSKATSDTPADQGFRQGLRDLGYVEGQTIVLDYRWAEGKPERYPALVSDLLRMPPDVILLMSQSALPALRATRSTIPVVAATMSDPVREGLAASLARPGGNITGLTLVSDDILAKRLQILKEAMPSASRIALLHNPRPNAASPAIYETAATTLGVRLQVLETRGRADIERVFAAMGRDRVQAVLLTQDILFVEEGRRIGELALKHRLPTMSGETGYAVGGGLMNYGPSLVDNFRRAAVFVDKILKGAKPGDLPIEQPTKFEFVINLKTAKALGLTIPESVLARAGQVVE